MNSAEELKDWMNKEDGLYKPGWDQLCKDYLNEAQEAVKAAGEIRFRHPDLSGVQCHLFFGEMCGKRIYSRTSRDKSSWTVIDHYAYFLWWVTKENTEDRHGIFFDKGLSEDIIHQRVWMVLERSNDIMTPSHKPDPPPAAPQSPITKDNNDESTNQPEQSSPDPAAKITAGSKRKELPDNSPTIPPAVEYAGSGIGKKMEK